MESDFTNRNGERSRTKYEEYEISEVKKHDSADDCWVVVDNSVYDVTGFLDTHPGGADLIVTRAGLDITDILRDEDLHAHSECAYNLLKDYKIGELKLSQNDETRYNSDTDNKDLSGFNEDLVDWNKGLVFQVHRFGTDYLKWVHSPVNKKLKLFDSDFVEFFSKTKWYWIPLIWIPITLMCSIYSLGELRKTMVKNYNSESVHLYTSISFVILYVAGIPLWTLMEYVLHRYIFHMEPNGNSPLMITIHFFFHGQHHKVPFDEDRLVFPPVAAGTFILGFWKFFNVCLPGGVGTSLFCGGLVGYIGYDLIHYYMHHGSPRKGTYLHEMKHYHVLHHFNDPSTGFGISTKFWDYPFDTVNKKLV